MSTSDSVDRVFVHALATVRRLPRTGSSRPPPSARLRLYGLYKQSMEGDVDAILPRPTLPPPSPQTNDPTSSQSNNNNGENSKNSNNNKEVHRYASRDLRTREAQAEIEKWDAWHACAGMSRTEAKRRYISTLIETMKEYASGTQESRELVGELEFVWGQISGGSGSSGSGSGHGEERESPRRSGLVKEDSFNEQTLPPGTSRARAGLGLLRNDTTETRMRMLSPVSPRDSDDIVEGEEVADPDVLTTEAQQPLPPSPPTGDPQWRTSIEAHLRRLSTEIAALREQLSSNHMLSSSSYSPYSYQQLSLKWKIWYRMSAWFRWLVWMAVRQACVNVVLLGVLFVWARWKGDRRVEEWARRRWKEIRSWVGHFDLRDITRMMRLNVVS